MTNAHGHGDGSAVEAAHAGDHDAHGAGQHDDDAHGGGHGDDPNAGIVLGTPPTPAWVLTAALIGLVTLVATVVLAVAMGDVGGSSGRDDTGSSSSEH